MLDYNLRALSTKLEGAELKESDEKYRSLFEAAHDAIVMVDRQGHISFANPKFFEVMGYRPEELEDLHFSRLLHPDDLSLVVDSYKRSLAGERVEANHQFRALTKDKRVIYVEGSFSLVKKEGKIIGIQAIVRDITQRKSLEENLQKRVNELKAVCDSTREMATSLNLDEALSTIVRESANILKVDGVIIRLLDPEHKILKVVKVHNLKRDSSAPAAITLGEGVLGRILPEGKPVAVEDVQKDPHYRDK